MVLSWAHARWYEAQYWGWFAPSQQIRGCSLILSLVANDYLSKYFSGVCVCVVSIWLFDGASLIPNRKYQSCLIFATPCQAALWWKSSSSWWEGADLESVSKWMLRTFYVPAFYGTVTVISVEIPPNSFCPFSTTACWRCWLPFYISFSSLPVAGSTVQQFSSEQVARDRKSGTETKKKHQFTGVLVYRPLSKELTSRKNTLN